MNDEKPIFGDVGDLNISPESHAKCLEIAKQADPAALAEAAKTLQVAIATAKSVEDMLARALLIGSTALKIAVAV